MKQCGLLIAQLFLLLVCSGTHAQDSRNIPFDRDWRFKKGSIAGAENPAYNDEGWRTLNLPHDWSIEDLPNQVKDSVTGPFSRTSIGKSATGFTVGGTGWYRKKFELPKTTQGKIVTIHFDGVYMNSDVWVNGHHLGNHPYGYSPFDYDLSSYLNPAGQENVVVVKVQNEGKNSRWYSGSGIYRHVWLTVTEQVHVANFGVYITTPQVSATSATVNIKTSINNALASLQNIVVVTTILSPGGTTVVTKQHSLALSANTSITDEQSIVVANPALWSVEKPSLCKAVTEIKAGGKVIDRVETVFGIRSLLFSGEKGFLLNGKRVLLKGGCIHHDNGPLGSAAIDRAEERKIEILKKAGYNAIRLSHNPPSKQLLDACDRLGMLVLDEAFDMWDNAKNANDYHVYFHEWWQKDLEAMITRDRNHPSVIMWSIGNEIYEAPDSIGHILAKQLSDEVRRLDPTRPVTEAIIYLPPYTKKKWQDYEPHLANLDIDGYNYFLESQSPYFQRDSATAHRFETEHAKHPQKVFISTESLAVDALENWEEAEKYPFFLGGFKWTAVDYLGEAGIGRPLLVPETMKLTKGMMGMGLFYKDAWPVYNAYCGDIDLVGNRKGASYYQSVVWRNSPVELLVHRPVPAGMKEAIAPWGSPDELKSWTWPGQEGKKIQVNIYTRSRYVKLELNGQVIAEQIMPAGTITASFDIDYQPGTLTAKTFDSDRQTGTSTLLTAGAPVAVRLVADRNTIKTGLNDLCYVSVEIVDVKGNVVPSVDGLEVSYQLTGNGTIAGVGNGSVDDMYSFQQNHKKVYQGRGLVIVRPNDKPGKIILTAKAEGLKEGSLEIVSGN